MNKNNILDKPAAVWSITILIVYSVVCFSIETLPDLPPSAIEFLRYSEMVVVAIFSLEYLYRLYVAEKRWTFIFSFYGIIDLLAILPFYLATAIDLRSLRLIRLLRLLRLLKLVRYNQALLRFAKAIYLAKEELVIFSAATLVMFFLLLWGFITLSIRRSQKCFALYSIACGGLLGHSLLLATEIFTQ